MTGRGGWEVTAEKFFWVRESNWKGWLGSNGREVFWGKGEQLEGMAGK